MAIHGHKLRRLHEKFQNNVDSYDDADEHRPCDGAFFFLPPAWLGRTYDAGSLGCSHSSAIQDRPKPPRNKTAPTTLRRVCMPCASASLGDGFLSSKIGRLGPQNLHLAFHCSFCRLAFCTPASLNARCDKRLSCFLIVWPPFGLHILASACQFSPSQPTERYSSLSIACSDSASV